MTKWLHCGTFIKAFLLTWIIPFLGFSFVYGQIPLKNISPFEISFTTGETLIDERTAQISLSDINTLSSYSLQTVFERWGEVEADGDTPNNFYLVDSSNEISIGKIQADPLSVETFFAVSYDNKTETPIGGFQLSFDFLYNFYLFDDDYNLSLKYRVNDGNFRSADAGTIRSDMLVSRSNSWDSFSIQLSINDIYLRSDDRIDFVWFVNEERPGGEISSAPITIQRIESRPIRHSADELQPGSLIISELMPPFELQNQVIEFIEIYNPADYSVSLKGIEIRTPAGEIVVQDDVYIEPFGVFVFHKEFVHPDIELTGNLTYRHSLLSENGGRIEMVRNNREISRATYEVSEPGVSLELNHAANASDGYISLRNFNPSDTRHQNNLYGSPGNLGNTVPVYKSVIEGQGWIFYSSPGRLFDSLNRNQSLYFFDHTLQLIPSSDIEPHDFVFIFKEGSAPANVFVEQAARTEGTSGFVEFPGQSKIIQTPTHKTVGFNKITDEFGNRISPAALLWDQIKNKFRLVTDGAEEIKGWQPVIVNSSVSNQVNILENDRVSADMDLNRFMEIQLRDDAGKPAADRAVIGFIDERNSRNNSRFDLPKLLSDFNTNQEYFEPEDSYIYLSSSITAQSANSFLHFPAELNQDYQLRLGHYLNSSDDRGTLQWNLSDEIPEEWILTLEDTQTGTAIDMREENSYTFRSADGVQRIQKDNGSPIFPVRATGEERFLITLQPFEPLIEEEEEEVPGSVELRQNYPNPFNPATNIVYYLPEDQSVRVGVYNVVGQQVAVLVDDTMSAGEHSVVWNAADMPSGIYIVQLDTGNRIFTRKITLIK